MNRYFTSSIVVVALLAAFTSTNPCRAGVAEDLPMPPEIAAAKAAMARVTQSKAVPAAAKQVARARLDELVGQFNSRWQPLQAAYGSFLDKARVHDSGVEDLNRQIDFHNKKPSVFRPGQEGAAAAYQAEANQLNAKATEWDNYKRDAVDPARERMLQQAQEVQDWLDTGAIQQFTQTATRMLGGIKFHKGQAWEDLMRATNGVTHTGEVFDGSDHDPDPGTIDTPVNGRN